MSDKKITLNLGDTKQTHQGVSSKTAVNRPVVSDVDTVGIKPNQAAFAEAIASHVKNSEDAETISKTDAWYTAGARTLSSFINQTGQYLTGMAKLVTDPTDAGGIPLVNTDLNDLSEFVDTLNPTPWSLRESLGYTAPSGFLQGIGRKIATMWNDETFKSIDAENEKKEEIYQQQVKERPLHIEEDDSVIGVIGAMTHRLEEWNKDWVQKHADGKANWFGAKWAYAADKAVADKLEELGSANTGSDVANWILNTTAGIGAAVVGGMVTGRTLAAPFNAAMKTGMLSNTAKAAAISKKLSAVAMGTMQTGSESMQIARDTYGETQEAMLRKINPEYDDQLDQFINEYALKNMDNPLAGNERSWGLGDNKVMEMAKDARDAFRKQQLEQMSEGNRKLIHDTSMKAYDMALVGNNANAFLEPIQSWFFLKGGIKGSVMKSMPTRFGGVKTFMKAGLPEVPEELNNSRSQDSAVKEAMGGVYTMKNFTDYLGSSKARDEALQGLLGGGFTGALAQSGTYRGRMLNYLAQQKVMGEQNKIGEADLDNLAKLTILSNSYHETVQAIHAMNHFKATGNEKEYKRESARMLGFQVQQALATGTIENLIKNYQKIVDSKDEAFATAEDGVETTRSQARRAIKEIKELEKIHNESLKWDNSNDIYQNRVYKRIIEQGMVENQLEMYENMDFNTLLADSKSNLKAKIEQGVLPEGLEQADLNKVFEDAPLELSNPVLKFAANYNTVSMASALKEAKQVLANNQKAYDKLTSKQYQNSYYKANQFRERMADVELYAQNKDAKFDKYTNEAYLATFDKLLKEVKGSMDESHYNEIALTHNDDLRNALAKKQQSQAAAAQKLFQQPEVKTETVVTEETVVKEENPEISEMTASILGINTLVEANGKKITGVSGTKAVEVNDEFDDDDLGDYNKLDQMQGKSSDPRIIPDDNLSDEQRLQMVDYVKKLMGIVQVNTPEAGFKELMEFFIENAGKQKADLAYDMLFKSYKLAGFKGSDTISYTDLYNSLFKIQNILDSGMSLLDNLMGEMLSPEQLAEKQKEEQDAIDAEASLRNGETKKDQDKTGTEFTKPAVVPTGPVLNTPQSTLSYVHIPTRQYTVIEDGQEKIKYEILSTEFEQNKFIPGSLKLLHPDMYHEGTELSVTVHPEFMSVPVIIYDENGKAGSSMTFAEWLEQRNETLVLEGKPLLDESSPEYIAKVPMVYTDSDGDMVAIVPDPARSSAYHNTEDTSGSYADNTMAIRNRVSKQGKATVKVQFKSLGHNSALDIKGDKVKTLAETDPNIVKVGYVDQNNKLAWGNGKPKDIIDDDLQIANLPYAYTKPGNAFELRRIGTVVTHKNGEKQSLPQYAIFLTTGNNKITAPIANTIWWAISTYLNKRNPKHPQIQTFENIITEINKMTNARINLANAPGDIGQLQKLLDMYLFTVKYSQFEQGDDVSVKIKKTIAYIKEGVNKNYQENKAKGINTVIGKPYIFTQGGKIIIGTAYPDGVATVAEEAFGMPMTSDANGFMGKLGAFLPQLLFNVDKIALNTNHPMPIISKQGVVEKGYESYDDYVKKTQTTTHDARKVTIMRNGREETFHVTYYQPRIEVALSDQAEISVEQAAIAVQTGKVTETQVEQVAEKIVEGVPLSETDKAIQVLAPGEVTGKIEQKQKDIPAAEKVYKDRDGKIITKEQFETNLKAELLKLKNKGLDGNVSSDPRQLNDGEVDQVVASSQIIKGLKRIHQVQVIDYIFNQVTAIVNASKTPISLDSLKKNIKAVFDNNFAKKREYHQANVEYYRNSIAAYPEYTELVEIMALSQEELNKYDLVMENWQAFEDDAITMIKKYKNIKQAHNTVTNLEDADAEDQDEWSEEDGSKDKDHSKSSAEVSNKEGVSSEVKMLCQNIQARDGLGNPMEGIFDLPVVVGFDTIFNTVSAWLAGIDANFETMKAIMEEHAETHPWVMDLIDKLEVKTVAEKQEDGSVINKVVGSKSVQNQFVSAMTKHPLDMEFIMMIKDRDGNYSLNVYNTNSGAIGRALIQQWKSNLKSPDTNLIISNDGRYQYNLTAIDIILDEMEELRGEDRSLQLYSKETAIVLQAVKNYIENDKKKGKGEISETGFYDATKGSGHRDVTVTGEEKGKLLKALAGKKGRYTTADKKTYTIEFKTGDTFRIKQYFKPKPSTQSLMNWLQHFGIRISEPTARQIIMDGFRYDSDNIIAWENQFQGEDSGNSKTLIANLANVIKTIKRNVEVERAEQLEKDGKVNDENNKSLYYDEDSESSKILGQSVIKSLAHMEAKHTTHRAVQSMYDNHKSIYGFVAPTFITDREKDLKRKGSEVVKQIRSTAFGKHSFWLDILSEADNSAFRENFSVKHLGLTALKEMGKALYRDNGLQELSDIDHEMTKLGMHQSMKQGDFKSKNPKYSGLTFRMARMFSPTMSDKSTMTHILTAILDITAANLNSPLNYKKLMDFAYSQMVAPELERIVDFKHRVISTNIDAYDKGAQMFLLMPALNNLEFQLLSGENTTIHEALKASSEIAKIEEKVILYGGKEMTIKEMLQLQITSHIKSEQAKKLAEWEKAGYVTKENEKYKGFKFFDKNYMKSRADGIHEQIETAALDFTLNSMIANANSFMAFAGDPAMCFKQDPKTQDKESQLGQIDYIQTAKDTFTNVGKRLASQIAPRTKMADSDSKSSNYLQLMMADSYRISHQIKGITKVLDGKEVTDKELEQVSEMSKRQKKAWASKHYPNSADYFIIESTNAQEYTTWREHLLVLEKMGKLSDEIDISLSEIKAAREIFSSNKTWEQLSAGQQELVKKILQPMKPVYTGQIYDKDAGAMRTMYIKTSSFPLIPQLTAGFEIDKLAKKMEELERNTGKTVRASYSSGNKVGGLTKPLNVFDGEGNFIEPDADMETYAIELPRKNFGLQQNIPLKSLSKNKDEISMGTQMTKLMFGNVVMHIKDFALGGHPITGAQLQKMYVEKYDEMVSNMKREMYHEMGINPKTGMPANPEKSIKKIAKILKSEATLRGYPKQDIEALGIDPATGELNLPIWLSPNSNRYEALLTAIITQRIVKVKFPGYSYVAGSQTGFKMQKGMEGINQSQVVFTDAFDGELKANQCLVASKLRVDGKLIDLIADGYAIKKKNSEGKEVWMIDTNKISPEVMKGMVSFRIPTSKHSSLESLEIAGFLPTASADLMIVSMDGTVAMGEDYDVDKRFNYHHWTTVENGKIIPLHKSEKYASKDKPASKVIDSLIVQAEKEINKFKRSIETSTLSNELKELADEIEVYFTGNQSSMAELDALIQKEDMIKQNEVKAAETLKAEIKSKRDYIAKLREDRKKVLQNEIIEIQSAVLNHADVKKISAEKLSVDDAKADAEYLSDVEVTDDSHFTPLSDMYQRQKVAIGAIGKNGTAAYSLDVVSQSLFEQAYNEGNAIQLMEEVMVEVNGKMRRVPQKVTITFGGITSTGKLGNQQTLSEGVDTYNGKRTSADVISERQNLMVDNEKEQIAIRIHLNRHTMMVDKVLNFLGFDKGDVLLDENKKEIMDADGNPVRNSISFLFISQPIVKEYIKRLENTNSNTAEYNPNKEADLVKALLTEYGFDDTSTLPERDTDMTNNNMMAQIKDGGSDRSFQAAVLVKFLNLQALGSQVTAVQTTLNIDSKGIGKNLLESQEKLEAVKALVDNKTVSGADKLIGDYKKTIDRKEVSDLLKQGYIIVERPTKQDPELPFFLIKPTTISGSFAVNGLMAATEVWSQFFPYNEKDIQQVFAEVLSLIGSSEISSKKSVEIKQKVVNEMKKYLYTDKAIEVFSDPIQVERKRLFMDDTVNITDKKTKVVTVQYNHMALATYLNEMLKSTDPAVKQFFKQNKLLQRFTYEMNTNGKPSLIKFDNSKAENFDEQYMYNALIEMMESKISLGDFNGKPYDTQKLAQDLVAYSYLEGGIQEAVQFIKYIPVAYLKVFGINNIIKDAQSQGFIQRNTLGVDRSKNTLSDFTLQFIQHNPNLVSKLTEDMMKDTTSYQKKIQSNNSDLSTLLSFAYTPPDGKNQEPFLSVYNEKLPKDGNKFQLYAFDKVTGVYNRVPVLGTFGMDEYVAGQSGYKSLVNSSKKDLPIIPPQVPLAPEPTPSKPVRFSMNSSDPRVVVQQIAAMDSPMGRLAKTLLPMMSEKTGFSVKSLSTNGQYDRSSDQITISSQAFESESLSDEDLARTMLREVVHSICDKELAIYTQPLPIKTMGKGTIVGYNGKQYIFWKKNEFGKAQLIDLETGVKFSGTPNMDKLTVTGGLKTAMYNGTEYIVTTDGKVYSTATGDRVYESDNNSNNTQRNAIISKAVMVKNHVREFGVYEPTIDGVVQKAPKHIKRLVAIFAEVQKELNKNGKLSALMAKGIENGVTAEEYNVTYAGYNIFEFVERMMTTPQIQEILNKIPFKDSDQSIMDKFYQWVSEVLMEVKEKLGLDVDPKNLTAQSLASIFEMISIKQNINPLSAETSNNQATETVQKAEEVIDKNNARTEEYQDDEGTEEYDELNQQTLSAIEENNPSQKSKKNSMGKWEFEFSDGIKVETGFKLNSQQEEALQKMADFANDKTKDVFTLMGYAGTGKTTIIKFLVDYMKKNPKNRYSDVVFSSPTHRANAVLKQSLRGQKVKTLHAVFGLSPEMDLEEFDATKAKFTQQKDELISQGDTLIIDESSMINDELHTFIIDASENLGIKVIFMGDPAQIKPVKQTHLSKVFKNTENYELTKVERTGDNPLLAEVTNIRNSTSGEPMSMTNRENQNGEGVTFMRSAQKMYEKAIELFTSEEFKQNPLLVRLVSGTNAMVADFNKKVREGIWGEKAKNEYNVGEIIMGYDNFDIDFRTKESKVINSGDYVVKAVSAPQNGHYGSVPVVYYDLTLQDALDTTKPPVRIKMLSKTNHSSVFTAIGAEFERIRIRAIQTKKWQEFYGFKAQFATPENITHNGQVKIKKTLDYGYAHTIHKSQGGTYKYIMVDSRDISKFQDTQLQRQLKYVALSRAQKHAYVLTNAEVKDGNTSSDPRIVGNDHVNINQLKKDGHFKGMPVEFVSHIPTEKTTPVALRHTSDGRILIVEDLFKDKYAIKAWRKSAKQSDDSYSTPLPTFQFSSMEEFLTFALLHEYAHGYMPRYKDEFTGEFEETRGAYEDRINQEALIKLKDYNAPAKLRRPPASIKINIFDKTNEAISSMLSDGSLTIKC